ncbi:Magnesium transporter NIPA [Phytophthora infestans]|uniref:Magnesium transporter NIPA n=1 Tax=Phytophthora infestans TaxID=4787 RepID=A0A8S9U8Y3_PHYIN|nr:Magnesium transporter NIPA [Phytophthora infestans]
MKTWEAFGAGLAVVASIVSNLGVNIQKYSHLNEAARPVRERRPYIRRPVWWVGFALVVLGSVGDFAAFGFATQSLVAALGGGATLVANVVTAQCLNGERLYKTDVGGVLFVIMGVVMIACIAEPNVEYPLPELELRFVRTPFVVYITCVGVCTVSMLATIKGSVANRLKNQVYWSNKRQKKLMKEFELRVERLEQRLLDMEVKLLQVTTSPASLPTGLGNPPAMSRELRELIESTNAEDAEADDEAAARESRVPYYYAICSGIVGAMTVLLAKCSAIMIALTLKGENQFKYGLTYIFLGGMFVCILVQTHFLNMATALGDIMTVFPIFQACWITFSVVGGAIFYQNDDEPFPTTDKVFYPLALLSIAVGVGLLVQHNSSSVKSKTCGSGRKTRAGSATKFGSNDEDDEILLDADASMSSPLLPARSREDEGYLHLSP